MEPKKKLTLGERKCKFGNREMYFEKINPIPTYKQRSVSSTYLSSE